ncbi:MAG: Ni-sirohydrochlorin a,c-diamide synthase [Methanoregulaceae archaeon]
MKALMVSGDRSGSGKTSITLAIAALLSRKLRVQTFKVGMDYIDPSYLTGVTGRPCRNLDSYVMNPAQVRMVFDHGRAGADIAIVEGVRGLYEGAEALGDAGSSAAIAKALSLDVFLVVDARSITRSAAALVKGFVAFDPDIRIRGVILNNLKKGSHTEKAVAAVEHYCGIPVVGAIPRIPEMQLTMRHLGLVPFREGEAGADFLQRIERITEIIGQYVDIDRLLALAGEAPAPVTRFPEFDDSIPRDIRIGVALDEAFNFYYSDLFDILHASGAEFIPFSPVKGSLPQADGYIIGGGYPEIFGEQLEANDRMREALREVSRNGVPIFAECAGLMYLTDRITLNAGWQDAPKEKSYAMCGVFPGHTVMPARRIVSYVEGESLPGSLLGAAGFRGHEFHYSDVILDRDTRYLYRITRGTGIRNQLDGASVNRTLASYTHLHPVSSAGMIRAFAEACRHPE